MVNVASVSQVRAAEEAAFAALGESDAPDGGTLMQRAAAGLATVVSRELELWAGGRYGAAVLVVVGAGNNGGDALYAGARLARRGVRVWLCATGSRHHDGGWQAARTAGAREVDHAAAVALVTDGRVAAVIDGILGIGGRAGLRGKPAELARCCRGTGVPVVAVDLPSGLDADRPGVPDEAFAATVTVTFGVRKPCHVLEPAASACGRVDVIDIGLGTVESTMRLWRPDEVRASWPVPGPTSDKYSRGVVGLDTGSPSYPGAAVLGVAGALHAGAGMVRFTGAAEAADLVLQHYPNVVQAPGRVQARVLGSGWGRRVDGDRAVTEALADGLPTVLDADAIGHRPTGRLGEQVLLTPHAGELARLLGVERAQVEADPVEALREAVRTTGATVLLKGATQYALAPTDPVVQIAVAGPAWTGQAGSGDVLAGICGALLAAGLAPVTAAVLAASGQALAARVRYGPYPPQQVAAALPEVITGQTAGPEHLAAQSSTATYPAGNVWSSKSEVR